MYISWKSWIFVMYCEEPYAYNSNWHTVGAQYVFMNVYVSCYTVKNQSNSFSLESKVKS